MSAFRTGVARCRRALLAGVGPTAALLLLAGTARTQPVERTLEHQGVARQYIVANAPAQSAAPRPVVLVLHGRRAAAEPHRSSPALDTLAVREGFAAVYPAGLSGGWNWPLRVESEAAPLSKAGSAIADDLGFLSRLVDRLIAERIADPARVYVSGASMGGFMTFGLMCAIPEKIAAAAALIATMTDKQVEACKPSRAVPVAMLAGTLDTLVPYEGRSQGGVRLLPVLDTFAFWRGVHDCRDTREEPVIEPARTGSGGIVTTRRAFGECASGGRLRLYRVDGGGHTLPSLRPQSQEELTRFGPRSTEFETSEEVWNFFKLFRL